MLSYQHHYHIGNHADILKHWLLSECVSYLQKKDKPFDYIDTHAGAGLYQLEDDKTQKLQEYHSGFSKLIAKADPAFDDFVALIQPYWQNQQYPGSPRLVIDLLRKQDKAWLFELHPQTFAELNSSCGKARQVHVKNEDGFTHLMGLLPSRSKRAVVLVDPAYEIKSDYQTVVDVLAKAHQRMPSATLMLWYPVVQRHLVDRLEADMAASGVRNCHLYELNITADTEQRGMTGSGVIIVNPPYTLTGICRDKLPILTQILAKDDAAFCRQLELVPE